MNKANAEEMMVVALNAGAELDRKLAKIQSSCSPDEFSRIRRQVGTVMASLLNEIIRPVYEEHPDLKPVMMGGTYQWAGRRSQ